MGFLCAFFSLRGLYYRIFPPPCCDLVQALCFRQHVSSPPLIWFCLQPGFSKPWPILNFTCLACSTELQCSQVLRGSPYLQCLSNLPDVRPYPLLVLPPAAVLEMPLNNIWSSSSHLCSITTKSYKWLVVQHCFSYDTNTQRFLLRLNRNDRLNIHSLLSYRLHQALIASDAFLHFFFCSSFTFSLVVSCEWHLVYFHGKHFVCGALTTSLWSHLDNYYFSDSELSVSDVVLAKIIQTQKIQVCD